MFATRRILTSLLLILGAVAALQVPIVLNQEDPIVLNHDSSDIHVDFPEQLDTEIYNNMFTYAHLMDITYCITETGGISKPFKCNMDCEERFGNMSLVHQWYADDAVAGYIATTQTNLFNYKQENKKTIVVALRGTRSVFDTIADMKVEFTDYSNLKIELPECVDCKVHHGFYSFFVNTLLEIHTILSKELHLDSDYELVIVGHSLGGSIALLLGLHYLDLGFDKLTVVTMGQPLVGNKAFVEWTDKVMGSNSIAEHNLFSRKYFRVIHKADVVSVLPQTKNVFERYQQFDNQIYLNCLSTEKQPQPDSVIDCKSGDNPYCIKNDFRNEWFFSRQLQRNYLVIHNTYFRQMGLCPVAKTRLGLPTEAKRSTQVT